MFKKKIQEPGAKSVAGTGAGQDWIGSTTLPINFLEFFLFLFENFALLDLDQHIECGSGSRRKNECGSGSRALIMCTILNRAPPKHTSVLYTSLEISISGAPRVHPRFFRVTLG